MFLPMGLEDSRELGTLSQHMATLQISEPLRETTSEGLEISFQQRNSRDASRDDEIPITINNHRNYELELRLKLEELRVKDKELELEKLKIQVLLNET